MRFLVRNLLATSVLLTCTQAMAAFTFREISAPLYTRGMSGDGKTFFGGFVGQGGTPAFFWTEANGFSYIPRNYQDGRGSEANDCSYDGKFIVGAEYPAHLGPTGWRWSAATGMVAFNPTLPSGYSYSWAEGVSDDGSVVTGYLDPPMSYRWTQQTGMQLLGHPPFGGSGAATSISGDGQVIAGRGPEYMWKWRAATGFQKIEMSNYSAGPQLNFDGTVMVGQTGANTRRAFRLAEGQSVQDITPAGAGSIADALAVSGDGSVVIGYYEVSSGVHDAFLWTAKLGTVNLREYLISKGVTVPSARLSVKALSRDGKTIFGGMDTGEHFLATIDIDPGLAALSVPVKIIGGEAGTGAITLSGPALSETSVGLSSSVSAAVVPASVAIAAGQSSKSFSISTVPVQADTPASITATLNGFTKTSTVTVLTAVPNLLTFTPNPIAGGSTATGVVGLNGFAPDEGAVVETFDDTSVINTPATVTVLKGFRSVRFAIPTTNVRATVTRKLFARRNGVTLSLNVTVNPGPVMQSFKITPNVTAGGNTVQGEITLNLSAPAGGLQIAVTDNSGAIHTPASVTVPAGATKAVFSIGTSHVDATYTRTVTITSNNQSLGANLTVTPTSLLLLEVTPSTIKGGTTAQGKVTLSGPAAANGVVVNLSTTSSALQVPPSVTVPGGQKTATFTVNSSPVSQNAVRHVTATFNLSKSVAVTLTP